MKQETLEKSEFSVSACKKDSLHSSSQTFDEMKIEVNRLKSSTLSVKSRNKLVKQIVNIFGEITNFKLLFENKSFALIVIANFFVFLGYFLPFLYIPIRGRELRITNTDKVLSVIGKNNLKIKYYLIF